MTGRNLFIICALVVEITLLWQIVELSGADRVAPASGGNRELHFPILRS